MRRVYQKTIEVDLFVNAMSLVYTTLLSLVPLLIFSFYLLTIFNFFGSMNNLVPRLKRAILNNLATGTGQTVVNFFEQHVNSININQLGVISFLSLVIVIIFLLARIEKTFNKIWGVSEHRDLFKRFVSFWTFVTLGTFLITLALSITLSAINAYFSSGWIDISLGENILFRFISFTTYFLIFIIGYYLIPNTEVEPLAAVIGGVISGSLFQLAKGGYTLYTTNVVTYNKLYGSLSAIPLFLIWLYLIWMITLLGAVIVYVFQHRSNLDFFITDKEVKLEVKLLIPLAILVILHKNFINAEQIGFTLNQLRERINLPVSLLKEELRRLEEEKLITLTRNNRYILLSPLEKLNLNQIYSSLLWDEELEVEKLIKDQEVYDLYRRLKRKTVDEFADLNLKDLIKDI